MADTPEAEGTQAEPEAAAPAETAQTETPAHASVGAPYQGLLDQAAEEHPYVPGEETIVGQPPEPEVAPSEETAETPPETPPAA
jgi:hypothetical protein